MTSSLTRKKYRPEVYSEAEPRLHRLERKIDAGAALSLRRKPVRFYPATQQTLLKRAAYDRDGGICAICSLDCTDLRRACFYVLRKIEAHALGYEFELWEFMRALGLDQRDLRRGTFWEADHIIPRCQGGPDDISNIRTLCLPHHQQITEQMKRNRRGTR